MKPFLDADFLLRTATARTLYHEYAAALPILDYHCHLPPNEIAEDRQFENLTQIWLAGDHYKWRAMRANGVAEHYITGAASDWEKFEKWAETVPYTLRSPLYHWTHLELQRYFGITELLRPQSARHIWEQANEQLQTPAFSVRSLLRRLNVQVVCTTDDPADSLEHHQALAASDFLLRVLPTFRPDQALAVENVAAYHAYLRKLGAAAEVDIQTYEDLLLALRRRHDVFHALGCRLSDHGLERLYATDHTAGQVSRAFHQVRAGQALNPGERDVFKSGLLVELARLDHARGWTQQFHLGALRNTNTRLRQQVGADAGTDSIGDFSQGRHLAAFLDCLDRQNELAQTIIYNLNPADNELMASMVGNFQDGSAGPGKMQWGAAWWFLDQKDGMEKQLNALSNLGLLSRFVGMLTDSRSFLSYPRHEYFRRILCNLLGQDVENGELPADLPGLGQLVQNVCYYNAQRYFKFDPVTTPVPERDAN
ncbi:glucuronate isomerase [uncultured Hymenobacter sp.]|uniref:glucuronate isomerase n=1 Tax=uncultured Hymenobacter sp. TaxID=170016 RepID=UPI0035CB2DD9